MRYIILIFAAVIFLFFLASVLALTLLLLLIWLLRAAWARLTGRQVKPWVFQFKPKAVWRGFEGFNGFPGFRTGPLPTTKSRSADDSVIDVTPKEIK